MTRYINWKISLFTVLLLPVLVLLGFWQLGREAEKRQLQALYEQRLSSPPMNAPLLSGMTPEQQAFASVRVSGTYDNAHSFLLDNRTHEGRIGVEVISPFTDQAGQVWLINRGWLQRGQYREDLPEFPPVDGETVLTANLYVPDGKPFTLGDEEAFKGWPRVLQSIDTERMFDELGVAQGQQGSPYTLRLQEGMPGVFSRYWQAVNMTPEKHRGYAIQWFAMAAALVILFISSIIRAVGKDRKTT